MSRRAAWLTAVVAIDIALLVVLRATGGAPALEVAAQAVLIAAFAALAIVDLRVAVAIVILELALGGASGRWTAFGGVLSGRLVLDGIVFAVAIWRLALTRDIPWRQRLGRYGVHALVVAVVLPGIWIPLGLVNGWRAVDAWGDGNGYIFFAFALVLAALATRSDLGWLRRGLLIACSATAALTVLLAAGLIAGAYDISQLGDVTLRVFDMGGAVGIFDGSIRIALGSGLYLLVGIALATWQIVDEPRRVWPWLLMLLFALALLVTYTRAFWLAAVVIVIVVAAVWLGDGRRAAYAAGAAVLLTMAITLAGWAVGFSLPNYVADRLATTLVIPDESVNAFEQEMGVVSNAIKVHQARVLLGHIAERPIHGWGFGAIAPDYRYGRTYSYELGYLALAYKAGIVGLLIFVSFPLRLLLDAVRVRLGRLQAPRGVTAREAAVPLAVVGALLAVGATNPYLVASFGIAPIVLMIAWLDPFTIRTSPAGREGRRLAAPPTAAANAPT